MISAIHRVSEAFFNKMRMAGLAKDCTLYKVQDQYDPDQGSTIPAETEIGRTVIILRDLTVKERSDMTRLGYKLTKNTRKGILLIGEIAPDGLAHGDKIVVDSRDFICIGVTDQNSATFEVLLRP